MLTIATLMASVVLALSAEKSLDLTGSGPDSFKAQIGKTVALRGRLEQGKSGLCLFDATPTNIVFYVIPDMPPSGSYTYPASWESLLHKKVRVTGELRFRSFRSGKKDSTVQIPPDYYYMVLQRTTVEGLDSK